MKTQQPIKCPSGIEINQNFLDAFEAIEKTDASIFITGRAGTGKSTFLKYVRDHTKKNRVVLASTGVAAVNVQGQTIHSFFRFKPDITVDLIPDIYIHPSMQNIYRHLELLIIDEVSMVRADLMDCIDYFLRLYGPSSALPFGGVQLILFGDLYQLAPVVRQNEKNIFSRHYKSPYFFDAKSMAKVKLDFFEFEINYRQEDDRFRKILNNIRTNSITRGDIDAINERVRADFEPNSKDFHIYLTTTNKLADAINYEKLHQLTEELWELEAVKHGDIVMKQLPTHDMLELKIGAQVIMLNNDSENRWINGSVGKIVDIFDSTYNNKTIVVKLASGEKVEVERFTWELFNFYYDEDSDVIESEVIGSFKQFPIKLAWAVTIHKSQGKTFDNVIIDIGRGTFCHGQLYVALSRCRTIDGMVLKRPISDRDVIMDRRIAEFFTNYHYQKSLRDWPEERKKAFIEQAIQDDQDIKIVYLKENTKRNTRKIKPYHLRSIEYQDKVCLGLEAYCYERDSNWIFRLPCIIDMTIVES